MAEDMLPSMLAQAIAKEMMVEALHEKKVIEEAYNSGNVVAGDFSKDKH